MYHFVGTYECKADVKGRIMLPATLRSQLAKTIAPQFVLKRAVFNDCLELYPIEEWEFMMNKINQLNRFNKKNNDFIRRFTAGVRLIEIDSTGRLLIPKDLLVHAGISKFTVISSAINILEIWDKSRYEEIINETTVDFVNLAEEVMGDKDEN